MNTPWGKSDSKISIERGVSWVGTPSHGGLAITASKAVQTLSSKAITIAMRERYGTEFVNLPKTAYLFFEEDCAYAIAFYEHPEWFRLLELTEANSIRRDDLASVPPYDGVVLKKEANAAKSDEQVKAEMVEVIRRYYPEYFGQEAK